MSVTVTSLNDRIAQFPERGARAIAEAEVLESLSKLTWLTAREAAMYLRLPNTNALRRRIERGTLPDWCWSRLGRSYRFNRRALDELMAGNATDALTMRALARR